MSLYSKYKIWFNTYDLIDVLSLHFLVHKMKFNFRTDFIIHDSILNSLLLFRPFICRQRLCLPNFCTCFIMKNLWEGESFFPNISCFFCYLSVYFSFMVVNFE